MRKIISLVFVLALIIFYGVNAKASIIPVAQGGICGTPQKDGSCSSNVGSITYGCVEGSCKPTPIPDTGETETSFCTCQIGPPKSMPVEEPAPESVSTDEPVAESIDTLATGNCTKGDSSCIGSIIGDTCIIDGVTNICYGDPRTGYCICRPKLEPTTKLTPVEEPVSEPVSAEGSAPEPAPTDKPAAVFEPDDGTRDVEDDISTCDAEEEATASSIKAAAAAVNCTNTTCTIYRGTGLFGTGFCSRMYCNPDGHNYTNDFQCLLGYPNDGSSQTAANAQCICARSAADCRQNGAGLTCTDSCNGKPCTNAGTGERIGTWQTTNSVGNPGCQCI